MRQRRDEECQRLASWRHAKDQLIESAVHLPLRDCLGGARSKKRAAAQKVFDAASPGAGIEATCLAMTLTVCHACDIFARPNHLTLKMTAWHKGFCAVSPGGAM
jgi:hypothetical protein